MKKIILFVDDDIPILNSIKRGFMRAQFKVITTNSPKSALEILKDNEIDIIVSDVKMPEMDGVEFLTIVKKEYPHINRIILSGYVEEETVFLAILQGIATTYFTKPWKAEDLRKKLEHILQMQEFLKNKKLLHILNSSIKLPVLPKVYSELLNAIGKKKSNKAIANIISDDVSVSTRILQVVNSAFYGIKTVSSIERGILLLGLNNIKDLVLTLTMISELKWNSFQKKVLEDILFHSSVVNSVFKLLYKKKYDQNIRDEFSSIGITHNIGKIIMLQYFPDEYKKIMDQNKEHPEKNFFDCELEVNNDIVPHTQIGAYVLNLWNLHSINVEAALYHHEPEKSSETNREIIEVFSMALKIIEEVKNHSNEESFEVENFTDNDFSSEDIKEVVTEIIEMNKNR